MEHLANGGWNVLIVDDEKDICYLLTSILRKRRLQVTLAGSLKEAEEAIKKEIPTLIFLDNHLPDGFGIEAINRFKTNYPGIKIIMITSYDFPSEEKKAFEEGADFFIGKPFSKEVIYKALDHIYSSNFVE